jgi:hypothetical protein
MSNGGRATRRFPRSTFAQDLMFLQRSVGSRHYPDEVGSLRAPRPAWPGKVAVVRPVPVLHWLPLGQRIQQETAGSSDAGGSGIYTEAKAKELRGKSFEL